MSASPEVFIAAVDMVSVSDEVLVVVSGVVTAAASADETWFSIAINSCSLTCFIERNCIALSLLALRSLTETYRPIPDVYPTRHTTGNRITVSQLKGQLG